jgi:serine/threonine protein kinase
MVKRKNQTKKRLRRSHKKSRKTRGGKVFGKGTYGIVFGKPRIPCDTEEFIRDRIESKQEVSKLFFDENEAKHVVATLELLNNAFTKDELKDLNKYFILPENLCKINTKEMKTHASVYNAAWREGTDLRKHKIQTTSDEGKHDLQTELLGATTKDEIITLLKKMRRIIEGIDMIHRKNIIHGDLKLQNTMVDLHGNFKIIDVDELRDVEKLNFDAAFFYNNHSYAIWPTLANMFLINYYPTKYATNDEFIRTTIVTSFNVNAVQDFTSQYSHTLSLITRSDFTSTFLEERDPANYKTMSDKIFKLLAKKYGKTTNDHLKAIYKYVDRYSFGIMLLTILKRYFDVVGVKDDDQIVEDIIELIENCCFIKNGLTTTTGEIKKHYADFVDSL